MLVSTYNVPTALKAHYLDQIMSLARGEAAQIQVGQQANIGP